jgi:hypothetical protein
MTSFILSEKFSDADLLSKKWYSLSGRLSTGERTSMTNIRLFRGLPGSPRDRATNGITCFSGDVGPDEAAEIRESAYRKCLFAVQGRCECFDVAARITDQNSHTVAKKTAAKAYSHRSGKRKLGADAAPRRNAVRPPDAGE